MKDGRCSLCNVDITQPLFLRELTDCPRCQIRATPTWQLDLENAEIERRHQEFQNQRVIVGLVACGKAKRPGRHPARHLYRSSLFQLSLRYAELRAHATYIISARHGLLDPDQQVAWYDERLADAVSAHGLAWRVLAALGARYGTRPLHLLILTGEVYARGLLADLAPGWIASTPLRGMPLFARLRFLKANLERPASAGRGRS